MRYGNWNLYDAEKVDGYPVNLQIIGKKLEEEKVLGAATIVEKIWKSRAKNI
jgi:Asp-tRNA(Asn)/Glu-tRNA(Gln) amidotransferase A subunit family amidase